MKLGVFLRLLLPLAAVGLPMLACQGGRVESCSELGTEWTTCDGLPNVCVLAKDKTKACRAAAGSATTTSPTTPVPTDGGVKCTSPIAPDVCGGKCVDLKSDRTNCGTCGVPCADSEFCANGECR